MCNIIAIAGRKQSGKTTSAEFIKKTFEDNKLGSAKIYNFADPLKKDVCMNIFGLTYHQCYGSDESKNELVNCYWPGTNSKMTAREVMQYVGTDVFRKIQQNVWADATIYKIQSEKPDLAIVADCRFPNEVEVITAVSGLAIKLNRNPYNSNHASEAALDSDVYDQTNFDLILNNQTLNIHQQNIFIKEFLSSKGVLPL
jgi:hypothetical protein